jgi:type II secretion system protein D
MRSRLCAREGTTPVWKLRRWLPGVVAVAAGLATAAGWAAAQAPAQPTMPAPATPGTIVPVPGVGTSTGTSTLPAEKTVTVNFKSAPWETVLDWFSTETGLTPIYNVHPTGSVTLQPPKDQRFTMGQVVDLLNEAMIQQKFILVRRQVSFTILPSDEKLDLSLVPRIELSELPHRGKTELVQVLIPLQSLAVEDTAPEVQKMLTPFGAVSMLVKTNTLVLVDTAGNANRIYQTLLDVENKSNAGDYLTHKFLYKKASDMAEELTKLLADKDTNVLNGGGAPPPYYDPYGRGAYDPYGRGGDPRGGDPRGGDPRDPRGSRGGTGGGASGRVKSVSITVDVKANTVTITAPPEKIALARKIIEEKDKPTAGQKTTYEYRDPELRKYPVPTGSADAVAKTLLAESPGLRIIALPTTNEILVLATPEEHFLITGKLKTSEGGGTVVETAVIPLVLSDPTEMASKLAKIFPSTAAGGATIEAQISGQPGIIVRGTQVQIADIRKTIQEIEGIKPTAPGGGTPGTRVLYLPPDGSSQIILEKIARTMTEMGRPTTVKDPSAPPKPIIPIRPETPPSAPGTFPGAPSPPGNLVIPKPPTNLSPQQPVLPGGMPMIPLGQPMGQGPPAIQAPRGPVTVYPLQSTDTTVLPGRGSDYQFIGAQITDPAKKDKKAVTIEVVGNKLVITSDDPDSLDLLMSLFQQYRPGGAPTDNLFRVLRLKNVLADDAAKELTEIFNGPQQANQPQGGGGRGGLLGGLIGGGGGGGLLGGLLGGGGGAATPAGVNPNRIRVVAEKSSNSVIVIKANQFDLTAIEFLLSKYIDGGPGEDTVTMRTWIVKVVNADASDMASTIKDVYKSVMSTGTSGAVSPFPFPFGQPQAQNNQKPPALSVSTDDRTNSLILFCTEALATEVAFLVQTLDEQTTANNQVVKIVPLKGVDPETVRQAVLAIQGINPVQQGRGGFGGGGFGGGPGGGGFGGGGLGGLGGGGFGGPGGGFGGGGFGGPGGGGFGGGGRGGFGGGGFGGGGGGRGGGGGGRGGGGRQASAAGAGGPLNFDYRGMDAPSALAGGTGMSSLLYDPSAESGDYLQNGSLLLPIQNQFGVGASDTYQLIAARGQPMTPKLPAAGTPIQLPPGTQSPRGTVTAYPINNSDTLVLRAENAQDMQIILDLIEALRTFAKGAQPRVELIPLEYADCNYAADFLTMLFSQVLKVGLSGSYLVQPTTGPGGGFGGGFGGAQQAANRGVFFLAMPQFNAIMVAAPEARFGDILKELRKIDQPNAPSVRPVVFHLKRASAQIVAYQLQQFWSTRYPGNPTTKNQFRVTFDSNSNTVSVQGSNADLEDVAKLINDWDTTESFAVNDVQIFILKQGAAQDVAQVISNALSAHVVNPLIQQQFTNPAAPTAGGTGSLQPGGAGALGGLGANLGAPGGLGALGGGGAGALGGGAAGGFGGAGGGANAIQNIQIQATAATVGQDQAGGIVTKSSTLRFYSGGQVYESGLLADVHLVPSQRNNAIIVAAPAKTMKLIAKLIENLDVPSAAQSFVNVYTLTKADASLTANLLRQLFTGSSTTTGGGGLGGGGGGLGGGGAAGGQFSNGARQLFLTGVGDISPGATLVGLQLTVDDRTNSIIVAGSQNDLDMIRAIIFKLESANTQSRYNEVYKLRNAAAADVASALTTFINSYLAVYNTTGGGAGGATGSYYSTYMQIQTQIIVVAEPVSNTVLISATPTYFNEIKRIIEQLDCQPPQVVIQVLIADVQLNNAEEFGVEGGLQSPILFARGQLATPTATGTTGVVNAANPGFNFNTTAPLGNSANATPAQVGFQSLSNLGVGRVGSQGFGGFVFSAASDSFTLLIRALKAQNRVDILSRPQVMVADNQTGFVQVGANYPYLSGSNVTGTGVVTQSVLYEPIGVTMRVTPRVNPDGKVLMRVEPTVSSVATIPVNLGSGIQAPAFNVETVQTTVLASDGETIVLGGMISKQDQRLENGYPFLKDIPYLGALFRYRQHQIQRHEVLVIMTPHIVRSEAERARILAEEAAKMHWCTPDIGKIQGHGMEVIGPAMQGARPVAVPPPGSQGALPGQPNAGYYVPGPAYFSGNGADTPSNPFGAQSGSVLGFPQQYGTGVIGQPMTSQPVTSQPVTAQPGVVQPPMFAPGAGQPTQANPPMQSLPGGTIPLPPPPPAQPAPGMSGVQGQNTAWPTTAPVAATGSMSPMAPTAAMAPPAQQYPSNPMPPVAPVAGMQPLPQGYPTAPMASIPYGCMVTPDGRLVPAPGYAPLAPLPPVGPISPTVSRGFIMTGGQQPQSNSGDPNQGNPGNGTPPPNRRLLSHDKSQDVNMDANKDAAKDKEDPSWTFGR